MERTVSLVIFVAFTLIGVAVIVSLLGGFRNEFSVTRTDCDESLCVDIDSLWCEGVDLVTCKYNERGCLVPSSEVCANGCNHTSGTCQP